MIFTTCILSNAKDDKDRKPKSDTDRGASCFHCAGSTTTDAFTFPINWLAAWLLCCLLADDCGGGGRRVSSDSSVWYVVVGLGDDVSTEGTTTTAAATVRHNHPQVQTISLKTDKIYKTKGLTL